jgi:hypothetical protein
VDYSGSLQVNTTIIISEFRLHLELLSQFQQLTTPTYMLVIWVTWLLAQLKNANLQDMLLIL